MTGWRASGTPAKRRADARLKHGQLDERLAAPRQDTGELAEVLELERLPGQMGEYAVADEPGVGDPVGDAVESHSGDGVELDERKSRAAAETAGIEASGGCMVTPGDFA